MACLIFQCLTITMYRDFLTKNIRTQTFLALNIALRIFGLAEKQP